MRSVVPETPFLRELWGYPALLRFGVGKEQIKMIVYSTKTLYFSGVSIGE
jgi:hypothetical protein